MMVTQKACHICLVMTLRFGRTAAVNDDDELMEASVSGTISVLTWLFHLSQHRHTITAQPTNAVCSDQPHLSCYSKYFPTLT